jgi:hypothetical protein
MDNSILEKLKQALGRKNLPVEPKVEEIITENGDTISIGDSSYSYGTITIGSTTSSTMYSMPTLGSFTVSNYPTTGIYNSTVTGGGLPWSHSTPSGILEVDGDDADVKINGKSLKEFMSKMEERLAILVPDPEKLEHFEALKRAYEHYRTLEALCELPKPEEDNQ